MTELKHIVGLWKFSDKISVEELGKVAEKWAAEDPNYLQLYIRKVSKDQYGIGFSYQIPEEANPREYHDKYFNEVSDKLKRMFGNDLAGWDIASKAWQIK